MNFDDIVKPSPGLCRCCLSEGCYKDLGTEYSWMNDTEVYADMLLDCFDIGITQHNDGPNGPKRLICEVCITRLRDACNFKKQVLDSEKKFIDMLGRGEFKSKVLSYQPEMKAESIEVPIEEPYLTDVEYLEDNIEYEDSEEVIKTEEPSTSQPTTSDREARPKRGRPKKPDAKPEKSPKPAKIAKVAKDSVDIEQKIYGLECKEKLATLLTVIIENSTVMPFRWHGNKYMCFFCACLFSDSARLKEHNHLEHPDKNILSSFRSLLKNSKVKLEISEMKCNLCSQEFINLHHLIDHLRDEHELEADIEVRSELHKLAYKLDDENMVCQVCGEKFQFFSMMLRHYYAVHNRNDHCICDVCGMFVAKTNIAAHVRNVHNRETNVPSPQSDASYSSTSNQYTASITSVKHKCPKCQEIFTTPYLKKRHLATVHNVKGKYKCDQCYLTFPVPSRLNRHKQSVHLKLRSLSCEFCDYKAFNRHGLNNHMVVHDDTKLLECEFCDKKFKRKKSFEFHRRIHTNDKRYVCKICGIAFVHTTSLRQHYKSHHPDKPRVSQRWY